MQEMQVLSLDWEDSPGRGHGNPLLGMDREEAGRLQSIGVQRVGHDVATKQQHHIKLN